MILSSPADVSVSSSLPKARAENGQVGSRNISNRRSPRPQVSGSARHDVSLIALIPVQEPEALDYGGWPPLADAIEL